MATKVADLFASLDLKPTSAWKGGLQLIRDMRVAFYGLGNLVGGFTDKFIGFSQSVEDAKIQIAGMLALAKGTDLNDQLKVTDQLYDSLRKRAAELPGSTQDYINMMGLLTQPIMDAGLSLKDLEDLTVNAYVAAKALNVPWRAAARDVDQALRGQYHAVDVLSSKLLTPMGYGGEEGRAKYNKLSKERRAEIYKQALLQKQIVQLGQAQAASFTGQLDKLKEATNQFLGRIGTGLFAASKETLVAANKWIVEHAKEIEAVAEDVGARIVATIEAAWEVFADFGTVLAGVYREMKPIVETALDLFGIFFSGQDILRGVIGLLSALAVRWFIVGFKAQWANIMMFGKITLLIKLYEKLKEYIGEIPAAIIAITTALVVFWPGLFKKLASWSLELFGVSRGYRAVAAAARDATAAAADYGVVAMNGQMAAPGSGVNGPGVVAAGGAGRAAGGAGRAAGGGGNFLRDWLLPTVIFSAGMDYLKDKVGEAPGGLEDTMKGALSGLPWMVGNYGAPELKAGAEPVSSTSNINITVNNAAAKDPNELADTIAAKVKEVTDMQLRAASRSLGGSRK